MADPVHSHAPRPRPDDTPPRNRVIFTYTVLAVLTLGGLKFVFDSYLDTSRSAVRATHIAESRTSEALAEYREQQQQRLAGGAMPIERAVRELGRRGRSAFPLIRPNPSEDRAALQGWSMLPRPVPPRPAPPAPEAAVPPVEGVPAEGAPTEGAAPALPGAEGASAPAGSPAAIAPGAAAPEAAAPAAAAPAAEAAAPAAAPARPARPARAARPAAPGGEAAPAGEAPPSE